MSIIQTKELAPIPTKTLIFFQPSPGQSSNRTLKNSFTYTWVDSFSQIVQDFRSFDIKNFPIICYDEGDMHLASLAYCIFKSMNLEVLVLYGGLRACEVEGLALAEQASVSVPSRAELREVDVNLLVNVSFRQSTCKCLPFSVYEVIGRDITVSKVKKLLDLHGIILSEDLKVLSGPSASLIALFVVYFGLDFPAVYLGDWIYETSEISERKQDDEVFHSIADSVYYDALEQIEESRRESLAKQDAKVMEHYKVPIIPGNQEAAEYKNEHPATEHCKSCLLL